MACPAKRGDMQKYPLLVNKILDYAAKWHKEQEVICRTPEGPITITTYAELAQRAQLCSLGLKSLGMREASMIATMSWNTTRHMEAWYGIMGIGGVVHTLNPRQSDKDNVYIMNDAEDVLLMSDFTFLPQLQRILPQVPSCAGVIFLTDRQHMPIEHGLPCPVYCYEELIKQQEPVLASLGPGGFKWEEVHEDAACGLCYTSGTTGNPKGVLYSHRAQFLHALVGVQVDSLPMGSSSCCMAIVPMFHANSWGLVFAAPMVGARFVLPGPWLDGESVYNIIERFSVTISAGVPTVWLNLLAYMARTKRRLSSLKVAVIGGAAAARSLIDALEKTHGVEVLHLWGMTELAPIGTIGGIKGAMAKANPEQRTALKLKQGRPHVLCDMRIVDDVGKEALHDGKSVGHLQVRGPHVVDTYYKKKERAVDQDNWLSTGDVASIDELGYMAITDRSKDVVKSGGEWISSIEIENLAMGHPAVAEAAVVAVPNEKWGERPLLVVVLKPPSVQDPLTAGSGPNDNEAIKEQLYKYLQKSLARHAVPDDIVFIPEIPHNATGKVSKLTLRQMFKDYKPPQARM
eukprot:CAMPEP_0202360492 /NCGR_PEP_ID=MMETSP1126-20121109/13416_1 /ASSEMBLY_ACC=CAM_ASM_000457 /TAXON_ID=3047 /ORGANISM="Dunaliella tertiolecta, Strain CCMP1320" /LENGTH=572 /DNA_ID=CAMNT_0048954221 /DNA_START=64 /DNA_END=1782 /DNA_ORIENTATION=+